MSNPKFISPKNTVSSHLINIEYVAHIQRTLLGTDSRPVIAFYLDSATLSECGNIPLYWVYSDELRCDEEFDRLKTALFRYL